MLYQRPSFTLPSSRHTSQRQWDFSFETKEAFLAKYGVDAKEYQPADVTDGRSN